MSTESEPEFDPEVAQLLARYEAGRRQPFDASALPQIREGFSRRSADRTVAPSVTVEDIVTNGVPVRLYRPKSAGPLPLHVFYHGGAFILGSALSGESDGALSRRAAESGAIVASVEYRLAPEHRFPSGVEDSHAALCGLVADATKHGFDTRAVSVGGISSGGNFAAVVALMARDRGGPKLAFQLIEIAGTDLTKSTTAWRTFHPGHDTTRERDLALIELYCDLAERALPYASPLFAPDLSGMAPAYIMSAEFDPRRDECEAYALRLRDAGVHVVSRTMQGHIHGSMSLPDWPPAAAWNAETNAVIARANADALAGRPVTFER